jgi:hypothetical protein
MHRVLIAFLVWLGASAVVQAQPLYLEAYVVDVRDGQRPVLSVRQDPCWSFQAPTFTVDAVARSVRVVQRISPAFCGVPPPSGTTEYPIPGSFPIGRYRIEYVQDAVGYLPPLPTVRSFYVRPAEHEWLRFDPVDPIALEPVQLFVSLIEFCERVDGVVPVNGGFRVVVRSTDFGPQCDVLGGQYVTIGAFAPGRYRIEVGRYGDDGAWFPTTYGTGTLEVRGALTASTLERRPTPASDLSGVWFSPLDAKSTGLTIFHARTPPPTPSGDGRDAITAIWYTYDEGRAPRWYIIVAEPQDFTGQFTGSVLSFSDATSPPSSRVVGNATLSFDFGATTGILRATVEGRTVELEIERFRWPIRAWPIRVGFPG